MKKQILMIVSLVWALSSMGQQADSTVYQSVFGDSVARWYEYRCVEGECTEVYKIFSNDTIRIDNLLYHKVRKVYFGGTDCDFGNEHLIGLYRENESHSKLFFRQINTRNADTTDEMTIMDLTLRVGDTLDSAGWDEGRFAGYRIIEGDAPRIVIDSIYYIEGKKVLRTTYRYDGVFGKENLCFIEGVGPSFGMKYAVNIPLSPLQRIVLVCYYRDTVFEYHSRYYDENPYYIEEDAMLDGHPHSRCEIWIIGGIEETENIFTIRPNPTTNFVETEILSGEQFDIEITDNSGKLLVKRTGLTGKTQIDISNFSKGIYFLIIKGAKGVETKKMIKL